MSWFSPANPSLHSPAAPHTRDCKNHCLKFFCATSLLQRLHFHLPPARLPAPSYSSGTTTGASFGRPGLFIQLQKHPLCPLVVFREEVSSPPLPSSKSYTQSPQAAPSFYRCSRVVSAGCTPVLMAYLLGAKRIKPMG